jgi:hypothetical protein
MNIAELIEKFKSIYGDFDVTFVRDSRHTGDLEIRFDKDYPVIAYLPVANCHPDFNDISPSMYDHGWELVSTYVATIELN